MKRVEREREKANKMRKICVINKCEVFGIRWAISGCRYYIDDASFSLGACSVLYSTTFGITFQILIIHI